MSNPFSEDFKHGFWTALYEYLIITMPVGIYVMLDVSHAYTDHSLMAHHFITSPESAIANIFLSFVSLSKYIASIFKAGKKVIAPIIGIMGILILIIIVLSTINAKMSIDCETHYAIVCRGVLFIISTIIFFIFMTGTKLIKK